MARSTPQSTIDAALKDARYTRKPRALAVVSQRGIGVLTLFMRTTQRGLGASWAIRYTNDQGERKLVPLGPYAERDEGASLSRATAIAEFNAWAVKAHGGARMVKEGGRVKGAYITEDEARPVAPSETVEALFRCYMDDYSQHWNTARTVGKRWSLWRCHCGPIAGRRARDLKAREVHELVLKPLIDAGHPTAANDLRKMLRAVYSAAWQMANGTPENARLPAKLADFGIEHDPLLALKAIEGSNNPRNRQMAIDDVAATYKHLGDDLTSLVARLSILLAGTRFTQLVRLLPKDFDVRRHVVYLDDWKGKRRKVTPRKYELPLGPEGRKVAAAIALAIGRDGENAPSSWMVSRCLRAAMIAAGVREEDSDRQSKDIRATFTTWLASQRVHQAVSNYIQSHETGSLVSRHYMGDLPADVQAALQLVEQKVMGRKGRVKKAA